MVFFTRAGGYSAISTPARASNKQHDAARVAELGGRLGVLVEEQIFDRADFGPMPFDHCTQLDLDARQAIGDGGLAVQVNHAVRDVTQAVALTRHHTPTEVKRTGIDAECEHSIHIARLRANGKRRGRRSV